MRYIITFFFLLGLDTFTVLCLTGSVPNTSTGLTIFRFSGAFSFGLLTGVLGTTSSSSSLDNTRRFVDFTF